MIDDGPNLNDHDFLNPGYLFVPSKQLLLTPKEISEDKKKWRRRTIYADYIW